MKVRFLSLPLILILTLTACAPAASQPSEAPVTVTSSCLAEAPTPSPEAAPAPTADVTPAPSAAPALPQREPPILDWLKDQPVPEFLDEEQQDLFLRAFSAATFLRCGSYGVEDDFPLKEGQVRLPQDEVVIDDMPYVVAGGRYARWDDFKSMMDGLFTPEYLEDALTLSDSSRPRFTSTGDGRLCFLDTQMGGDIEYGWCDTPDSYELVSQTEDEIVFDFIGHYVHLDYDPAADMPAPQDEYTRSYPIRMVRTDDGWRFDQFSFHF